MKNLRILLIVIVMGVSGLRAQIIVNGFQTDLEGPEIDYHSPHPLAHHALITRATDGRMKIVWQSGKIPILLESRPIKVIWLAGLGCNLGNKPFTPKINGDSILTFSTVNESN